MRGKEKKQQLSKIKRKTSENIVRKSYSSNYVSLCQSCGWKVPVIILVCIFSTLIFIFETNNTVQLSSPSPKLQSLRLSNQIITLNPIEILTETSKTIDNSLQESTTSQETTIPENTKSTQHKYAYVTLMSGIDQSLKYRGFFYNTLIMRKSLVDMGSTADFIVMLGFNDKNNSFFDADEAVLKSFGVILYHLPRFVEDSSRLSFAEMALLKITPLSFVQYEKVQFFDGDIMPTKNLDCFFELPYNTFNNGAASPLNSGWYLIIPNLDIYNDLKKFALWRLGRDWDKINGWGDPLPKDQLMYRGGKKPCNLWDFNGADMDQGLFTHYFVLHHGNVVLMDSETKVTRYFEAGLLNKSDQKFKMNEYLKSCEGLDAPSYFVHFTGKSKPWIKSDKVIKDGSLTDLWMERLESLNINVTAEMVTSNNLNSPLGYWNANFPKGGFKKVQDS